MVTASNANARRVGGCRLSFRGTTVLCMWGLRRRRQAPPVPAAGHVGDPGRAGAIPAPRSS